jgi:hypothetical protein
MAFEVPIVRHFVASLEVVVAPDSHDVTLHNLIHAIVRLPGEPFPCIRDKMALYALLTNGRGEHELAVQLAFLNQGTEETLVTSPSRRVDFGHDPTAVFGLPIPLKNVVFQRAGQYTFYLLCDEKQIAHVHVEVR